jgi:regulator of replication initiation timing
MLELRSSLGRARVETVALKKAHAAATARNDTLQDENDKLRYRVAHLVRHVKGDSA